MVPTLPVRQWSQVAPDQPVIRINWPRVAFVGLLVAILGMLLTLVFRAASERNAQAGWRGAVAAAPISSASQVDPATPQFVGPATSQFIAEVAAEGTDDHLPLGISVRAENNASEQVTSNIREPDSEQILLLLRVAERLLAAGDLSTARTLLWRAAKAGNARAALLLGETYDPGLLDRYGLSSLHADPAMARTWYGVASEFGSPDAQRRLSRLSRVKQLSDLPSRP